MKKRSLAKTVIKNSFFNSLTGAISKIGGFIFVIIIARALFPEIFGVYSLTMAIIGVFISLSELGLVGAMHRYVSESLGKKNGKKEARSRFLFLFKYKFIISLFVSILLFVTAELISSIFNEPLMTLPLRIASIYLFVTFLYEFFSSVFIPLKKLKYVTVVEIVLQVSRLVFLFLFFFLYKSVETIFFILILSSTTALLTAIFILKAKYPFLIKGKKVHVPRKRILTFSGFMYLGALGIMLFGSIDKLMLGYFLPLEFIAYYTLMLTLITSVFAVVGLPAVLLPVYTQLKKNVLEKAFQKTTRWASLIAVPMAVGLAYVSVPAIIIIYGAQYVPNEPRIIFQITAAIFSLVIIEGVLSTNYTVLLNSREKEKYPAMLMIIASILNVVLNGVLIYYLVSIKPALGLIGAASATIASRYLFLESLIIFAKKKLNVSLDPSHLLKPILASLIMLAFLFIYDYFIVLNIISGLIMILIAAIIYFLVLFLIKGFTKADIETVKLLIAK